jgi:transposase InsO family protein
MVFKLLHQSYHLGIHKTLLRASQLFEGIKLKDTLQDIIRGCEICQHNNPHNSALPVPGTQRRGTHPGEDWPPDFTHLPGDPTSKLLLVVVDTFTGWVEAFPCFSEKAREVVKVLINEIIPRFGLPRTLQNDNGPAFSAEVTQGISKALGIKYHLHCAWRPQSSSKVERAKDCLRGICLSWH